MYEDFYAFIPGSLEARQRLRKLRLKRLLYSVGAIAIFSSGFILGLEWHDPNLAQRQLASAGDSPFETVLTPPVAIAEPDIQLENPSLTSLPVPTSELIPQADVKTEASKAITETDVSQLAAQSSTIMLDAKARPPATSVTDHASAVVQTEAVKPAVASSQPKVAKPEPPKPDTPNVENHEPQPAVSDADVSTSSTASQPASASKASTPAPARPYLVQVGAFKNAANARGVVMKLQEKGYRPFIRAVQSSQNRILHRVFIERVNDRAQAQAAAKAFEAAEKMDALVMLADTVSEPPASQ